MNKREWGLLIYYFLLGWGVLFYCYPTNSLGMLEIGSGETIPETAIELNDDAYHITYIPPSTEMWFVCDQFKQLRVMNGAVNIDNIYMRFPIESPPKRTISAATLHLNVEELENDPTFKIYVIDLDHCPAFPPTIQGTSAAGEETPYPATTTSINWTPALGANSIDITTLVQAFVNRVGYVEGNTIGLKIDNNAQAADHWAHLTAAEAETADSPSYEYTWADSFIVDCVEAGDLVSIITETSDIVAHLVSRVNIHLHCNLCFFSSMLNQ